MENIGKFYQEKSVLFEQIAKNTLQMVKQ
jgi:aspartate kinase